MSNPSNPQPGGTDSLDLIASELSQLLKLGIHDEATRQSLIEIWNRIPTEAEQDVIAITKLHMRSTATMLWAEVVNFLETCGMDPAQISLDEPDVNQRIAAAMFKTGLHIRQIEKDGADARARLQGYQKGGRFILWMNLFVWLPLASVLDGWLLHEALYPAATPPVEPNVVIALMPVTFFLTGMCLQQVVGYFSFRRLLAPLTHLGLQSKIGSSEVDPVTPRP